MNFRWVSMSVSILNRNYDCDAPRKRNTIILILNSKQMYKITFLLLSIILIGFGLFANISFVLGR